VQVASKNKSKKKKKKQPEETNLPQVTNTYGAISKPTQSKSDRTIGESIALLNAFNSRLKIIIDSNPGMDRDAARSLVAAELCTNHHQMSSVSSMLKQGKEYGFPFEQHMNDVFNVLMKFNIVKQAENGIKDKRKARVHAP
jgi:hypothetical protein